MPVDKWGIKFLYPTKKTAGITDAGHGFFWQQDNNIFNDSDDGMVHLGKEFDKVKVINSSTGEWEFPYLTDGDGLSMSGPTGHHSGGETHECQGFTYMCDGNFAANPPTFRFRKETYHVQYNNDPKTGVWSSPFATGPVANNWKGLCWVRYNKKDGRGAGKDSVICEYWWNDNPTADINNWHMLKRTEDLGAGTGKSNWGVKATCDGDDYQVGTWSNIQFRFKSSSSDFSLHPIIPEHEDERIESIGKVNMSFSDCENRGYGKRADMPRDIEMKCLLKWDAGGRGKAHFKNLSLREIDPSLDFGDVPTDGGTPPPPTPEPTDQPPKTTTIQGSFKLFRDININRVGLCAVAGSKIFYDQADASDDIHFLFNGDVTRMSQQILNSSSGAYNKKPIQVDVSLYKEGSPTGNVSCKIWSNAGSVVYTSPTTINSATLTTSFVRYTFDFSTNTRFLQVGDRVGIEYTGGDVDNHVVGEFLSFSSLTNSTYSQYSSDAAWHQFDREFGCVMWE